MLYSPLHDPIPQKLIEVDLPLDAINKESAREKSIRHGHPSTLHHWWARRPLAACRAVLFASMVDDPSALPDEFPTEDARKAERDRLHRIIERLVVWENSNDEALLADARYEIVRSVARSRRELAPALPDDVLAYLRDNAPPVYDPFAGGGSIPLEAQRLGLRAVASDLNPVAVLINKALIELPPKVAGKPPANPDARSAGAEWRGAAGLASDVRYYGKWMRDRAFERIGHLYPKAKLPDGGEATVIAWLWARTIPCPNPACGIPMPMMKSFELSKKPGNRWWTRPVVDPAAKRVRFVAQDHSEGVPSGGTVDRNGARCVACGATETLVYVREQAKAGKMGEQMIAIVAEGKRGRLFLSPTEEHERVALAAEPEWRPQGRLPAKALGVAVQGYGFLHWNQMFTERQLVLLTTLSPLFEEAQDLIMSHGAGKERAEIIGTYLGLAIGRTVNSGCNFAKWQNLGDKVAQIFTLNAIAMIWDFAEANAFSNSTQNWMAQIEWIAKSVLMLPIDVSPLSVHQSDASTMQPADYGPVIVTDPPYYDNVGYADLSDFFYVWLRPLFRNLYPELFASISSPKDGEIIAAPRFVNANERFEDLLSDALRLMREQCDDEFPSSLFYAYKQQEENDGGRASTGWETMLSGLIQAGFQITGTWPMRTERSGRPRAFEANSLATSVVIVCRPREEHAPVGNRTQFLQELGRELPAALDRLTHDGHIGPVDLRQAAIGPGMQVYSRYARVERMDGEPFTVRDALQEINKAVDFYTERAEGELDAPSRFCLAWLRTHGHAKRPFGDAETLAKPMNVSVDALSAAGLLMAERGEVRLYEIPDYAPEASPRSGSATVASSRGGRNPAYASAGSLLGGSEPGGASRRGRSPGSASDDSPHSGPARSGSASDDSPHSGPALGGSATGASSRGRRNPASASAAEALGDASAWEGCYRMAYHFHSGAEGRGGIDGAAMVALALSGSALDAAQRLAPILYDVYDRRGDARVAAACNDLAGAWETVLRRAQDLRAHGQGMLM